MWTEKESVPSSYAMAVMSLLPAAEAKPREGEPGPKLFAIRGEIVGITNVESEPHSHEQSSFRLSIVFSLFFFGVEGMKP